jgi:branched-chain amino acid transport system substrate-binding protein
MVHDMYLVEVKTPSESKEPWDIAKVRQVIPGEEAVAPLEKSSCPFLEKR